MNRITRQTIRSVQRAFEVYLIAIVFMVGGFKGAEALLMGWSIAPEEVARAFVLVVTVTFPLYFVGVAVVHAAIETSGLDDGDRVDELESVASPKQRDDARSEA